MAYLDPIFVSSPVDGFQDIWFLGLKPQEVASLYNFACLTYGAEHAQARLIDDADAAHGLSHFLYDTHYEFKPLNFRGVQLDGVVIRIEADSLAIDFDSGTEYWNERRQTTFISWLRALHQRAPNAELAWAHEGCITTPSEYESDLLRRAVASAA